MKGGMLIVFGCVCTEILDPGIPCIDLEMTLYIVTLGQGSKMKVMDQGPDLLVEYTLCVLQSQFPVLFF